VITKKTFLIFCMILVGMIGMVHAQESANVIEFNSTEFGTLTASNPVEAWQFEGFAADLIAVEMNQVMSELDPYLVVQDPLGRIIGTDNDGNYPNAFISDLRLPLTGTYTILAQSTRQTTGDYELTLTRLEPGMVFGQQADGGELEFGIAIIGGISNESRLDTWTFEGLPGDRVTIIAKRLSGTLTIHMRLLDPTGVTLQTVTNNYEDTVTIDAYLEQAGTYTVLLQRPPGNSSAGDYELKVDRTEIGFLPKNGGGEVVYNAPQEGTLWTGDLLDEWQFVGTAGDALDITAQLFIETNDSSSYSLQLISPEGEIIAVGNYDYESFTFAIRGFVITADGAYSVIFSKGSGYYSSETIDYIFEITYLRSVSPAQNTTIILGERHISAILSDHPIDEWQFEGIANDRVTISASPIGGSMRIFFALLTPEGFILSTSNDGYYYDDEPRYIEVTLPTTGTYQLITHADVYNLESTGSYVISTFITETGDGRNVINGGGEMVVGDILGGYISNNDPDDRYSLQIDTPTTITISVTRMDGNLNAYVEILDEAGAVIASDDDSAGALNPILADVELAEGQYFVVVRRPDSDTLSEGIYELSIQP